MDWGEVTGRVAVEACGAAREDVVLFCGDDAVGDALAAQAGTLVRRDDVGDPPPGLTIICLHAWLRRRPPAAQRAAIQAAGRLLRSRGLLVIADAMWSLPPDQLDDPGQFGDELDHVQTTGTLEGWVREAGFLPDTHRFAPGAGVLVALRA